MNIGKILKLKNKIDRCMFHQSIRTLVAGLLAIFLVRYIVAPQSYWIILSAVLLVQIRVGNLIHQHIVYQLMAGIIAALLSFVSGYLGANIFVLALVLSLTSAASVYLGFRKINLFLPAYLVNLLVMISGGVIVGFNAALMRSEFILCGMVIALLVTIFLWPSILRFKIESMKQHCLNTCFQLLKVFFDVYLKKDYSTEHFFYEKKIYYLNRLFSRRMIVFRYLNERLKSKDYAQQVAKIDKIFEIITGLGSLRYRVKNHAVWGMVNIELKDILSALERRFHQATQKTYDRVEDYIDSFDAIYRGALQVASQEPIVYLFFVQGLRALNEEISFKTLSPANNNEIEKNSSDAGEG